MEQVHLIIKPLIGRGGPIYLKQILTQEIYSIPDISVYEHELLDGKWLNYRFECVARLAMLVLEVAIAGNRKWLHRMRR